ncbi:hypothetical protein M422DRAFT_55772 [Sphaerobolus stellatus SS14]|uniref:Uncharacterized protein n=1 Tax=Sphaerobolus stellatus (strain SS14) TaxID=990650 RepID=A0A0C9TVN2_SPHS4|nr:hypothetical protein M422DRAFT_55772 [Sphaerobolus stellatus SS14]
MAPKNWLGVVPPHKTLNYWENAGCKGFQDRHWFVPNYPQLALIPKNPVYDGPLLQCLWLDHPLKWLTHTGNLWMLHKEIVQSWMPLERALYMIANALMKEAKIAFDLNFDFLPLPSSRGYLQTHKSEENAVKCIYWSRDTFLGLLAIISLGVLLFERKTLLPDMDSPWIEYLVKKLTGNVRRLRTFIDVNGFSSFKLLRELLKADVPVWFSWGAVSCKPCRTCWAIVDDWIPPTTDLGQILSYYTPPMSSVVQPAHTPVPDWSLRQHIGEHWRHFFKRVQLRHALIQNSESFEEKVARLQREEKALTTHYLATAGLFGVKVYAWIKFPGGSRVRTLLNRGELLWRWDMYSEQERHYNAHDNEWDWCSEFGDSGLDSIEDFSYLDDDEMSTYEPLNMEQEVDTQGDYEMALGTINISLIPNQYNFEKQNFLNICYTHYGLQSTPSNAPLEVDIESLPIHHWDQSK